jgi:hypothetical protein
VVAAFDVGSAGGHLNQLVCVLRYTRQHFVAATSMGRPFLMSFSSTGSRWLLAIQNDRSLFYIIPLIAVTDLSAIT